MHRFISYLPQTHHKTFCYFTLPSKSSCFMFDQKVLLLRIFFCSVVVSTHKTRWKIDLTNNILNKLCFFPLFRISTPSFACVQIMTNCVYTDTTMDAKLDWNFKLSFRTWMAEFIVELSFIVYFLLSFASSCSTLFKSFRKR